MFGHLEELMTRYGLVCELWLDLTQVYRADGVKLTITNAVATPRIAHLAANHRQTCGLRPIYRLL
jgi:hypothetical protein